MAVSVTLLNHKVYDIVLRLNSVACPRNLTVVAVCDLGKLLTRRVFLRVYCTSVQYGVVRVAQACVGAEGCVGGSDRVQGKEFKLSAFTVECRGHVLPQSHGVTGATNGLSVCVW